MSPNCIQLYKIGESTPSTFQSIDDEMRVYFGAPPDDKNWYRYWYDIIAFSLVCGYSYNNIRKTYPDMTDIVDWLEANYTANTWVEFGRR